MKIFDHPNMEGWNCPICGTNEDKPVTLIPVVGTKQGNIAEAKQIHVECLDLTIAKYSVNDSIIFITFKEEI